LEQHRREIALTEGIYDITPHLPEPEMTLDEAFAIARSYEKLFPTLGNNTESE